MKTTFTIEETVLNQYEVQFNEEALEKSKYSSINEYIQEEGGGNPWFLINGDIISDILFDTTIEFLDTKLETLNIDE